MPRYLRCACIDRDDLLAGRLESALRAALARPAPPERLATNGADAVVDLIIKTL